MKTRALWYTLVVGAVSMTSGCCCFHECFPNVGWRLHQPCAPSCSPCSPCAHGPAFRPPMVVSGGPVVPGPDCPSCGMGGAPAFHQPVGYPPVGYPPVIGKPMPIVPGNNELPNPMPVKPGTGN